MTSESSNTLPISEFYPGSRIVTIKGVELFYQSGDNAFWLKTTRSDFHREALAMMVKARWLVLLDSVSEDGETIYTSPDEQYKSAAVNPKITDVDFPVIEDRKFIALDPEITDVCFITQESGEVYDLPVLQDYINS